jgi:hypothetical protein
MSNATCATCRHNRRELPFSNGMRVIRGWGMCMAPELGNPRAADGLALLPRIMPLTASCELHEPAPA